MTIAINQDMLNRITDDKRDQWDGVITFSIDVDAGSYGSPLESFERLRWTETDRAAMIEIAAYWDDVIAREIRYVFNNDEEDIVINKTNGLPKNSGGRTYSTLHSILPDDADIFLKPDAIVRGDFAWNAAMHEFGHALGLQHPGDYDASQGKVTYKHDRLYDQDTSQFSIMSYFEAYEYTSDVMWTNDNKWLRRRIESPMVYDILAIQAYYGVDTTTRLGNTTYGFNSTANRAGFIFNKMARTPVFCIWDAGGDRDKIDASEYSQAQMIDLSEGSYSNIGGLAANISIAFKTIIEDATGGTGNDQIHGNAAGNLLDGGSGLGKDELHGYDGDDTLLGGAGNDKLFGQTGNDDLDGGSGQDSLDGAEGDDHLRTTDIRSIDVLDGGSGINRLSADYSDKTVSINWILGQNNDITFADGDTERNFQNVGELNTANWPDVIRLDGLLDDGYANIIRTNGGDDLVYSGQGNDKIEGGSGKDKLYGGSESDTIDGGAGDDFINGGSNNILLSFGPFGTVVGYMLKPGDSGPDHLYGGAGVDTLSFEDLQQFVRNQGAGSDNGKLFGLGVDVDLATNANGRAAIGIVMNGFENIIGTNYGDNLKGDDKDNIFKPLRGGGWESVTISGPDRIDGRGGSDTLEIDFSLADLPEAKGVYTNGTSISRQTLDNRSTVDSYTYSDIEQLRITGASKDDILYSWSFQPQNDRLSGLDGNDRLGGKGGSDTLLGGSGDDTISAQGTFDLDYNGAADGHDVIDGGDGNDIIEDIGFGGTGPILAAGTLFKLNGGAGFDTLSADFSNQTASMKWSSATPTNLVFADGAYAKNFEQLRYFASGSGNDAISQLGRSNTQIFLGAGDDTVNTGMGIDVARGGDGNDLLILDYSTGDMEGLSGLQGGGLENTFYRRMIVGGSRPDSLSFSGFERVQVTGSIKDDKFLGSLGDDTLYGSNGNDYIGGLSSGNDYIDGGSGNDTLWGSAGSLAPGSADTLLGGDGDDILQALTGDDSLIGGAGNDKLIAEFNNLGGGSDWLSGGAGNDFISDISSNILNSSAKVTDQLRLDGGIGNDTLSADFGLQQEAFVFTSGFSNAFTFSNGSFFKNFEQIGDLISGSGNDRVTLSGRFNNSFVTGNGDDTINLGLGIDKLYAGNGFDNLICDYSKGDDANLSGVLNENGGFVRRDLVTNAIVDFLYHSEVERVLMTGGSKGDVLYGAVGDDVISGGAGDDLLRGSTGRDTLDGGAGKDTAEYGEKFTSVVATLNGPNAVSVLVDGVVEDSIRNFENLKGGQKGDTLTGDNRVNVLSGGDGNDLLDGGGGADVLEGGRENDTYRVDHLSDSVVEAIGAGFDTVQTSITYALGAGQEIEVFSVLDPASIKPIRFTGNEFAQAITGNAGANGIEGGLGADTLTGLGGADSFVFNSLGGGVDVIQDFVSGTDSVRVSAAGFGGGLGVGRMAKLASTTDFATFSSSPDAHFIYDLEGVDAGLYFDANGGSGIDSVLFVKLIGLSTLVPSDLVLI